jgi:hypothetical protein
MQNHRRPEGLHDSRQRGTAVRSPPELELDAPPDEPDDPDDEPPPELLLALDPPESPDT